MGMPLMTILWFGGLYVLFLQKLHFNQWYRVSLLVLLSYSMYIYILSVSLLIPCRLTSGMDAFLTVCSHCSVISFGAILLICSFASSFIPCCYHNFVFCIFLAESIVLLSLSSLYFCSSFFLCIGS